MDSTSISLSDNNVWIFDTDFSDDDQVCLDILLRKIKIIAITTVGTCTKSPRTIKQEVENFLKERNVVIKVYAGADRPFIDFPKQYGDNALHNPYNFSSSSSEGVMEDPVSQPTNIEEIRTKINEIASVKIVELAKENTGNINIISTGPLTNLALAGALDNNSLNNYVNAFFITGGSLNTVGNSGSSSEYNIRYDAVSSKNLLKFCNTAKFYFIPLEVEMQLKPLITQEVLNDLVDNSKVAKCVKENFAELNLKTPKIHPYPQKYYSNLSFYTAMIITNLSCIEKMSKWPCTVDYFGQQSRGCLIFDGQFIPNKGDKTVVNFIESLDSAKFLASLRSL